MNRRQGLELTRAFAGGFLVWLGMTLGSWATEPNPKVVFDLLAERLSIMKSVASYKLDRDLPVEDKSREAIVLEKAAEGAARDGLDPLLVRPFFEANIEAAKTVQHCWIERWRSGQNEAPAQVPDLIKVIRPRLIAIGSRLNQALAQYLTAGGEFGPQEEADYQEVLQLDCLATADREALYKTLEQVRLEAD